MEIKYQMDLYSSPIITPTAGGFVGQNYSFKLTPLAIDSIVQLENKYNNCNQFPASLRELLYLAGERCYVLDYGINDTQEEMQDDVREWLVDYDITITRPFYAIDVYGGSDNFLFVYLDENVDDPMVQVANLCNVPNSWLLTSSYTLSAFINDRITVRKNGYNPF